MPRRQKELETPTFVKGDAVAWDTPQGETHGTIEREVTSPMRRSGHDVAASPANPEYLVKKSDKTGAEAAHEPSALRKKPEQSS
ncbi:MAG: DUF2945 domain-containing protein [Gemmatirosa sp.]